MLELTREEQLMLEGKNGLAAQKAMEILVALGTIYGAQYLLPVASVQIAGVSFDNLGEAGLDFLAEMAAGGGKARVLTTLNPAGMDINNWQALGINAEFARNQERVINAFAGMGVITTCSCTPYLFGNLPHFGQDIAWAESSAVCYANSVLGARTNREGGPSALAAALTGKTPNYGLHLPEMRKPAITVKVAATLDGTRDFGALGVVLGKIIESKKGKPIPYIKGIKDAPLDSLKSFCASIATYGGAALFHMEGITPECAYYPVPEETLVISRQELDKAIAGLNEADAEDVDFVSLGCPHLSLSEIIRIAEILKGKHVTKTFWITVARPTKQIADQMGYSRVIEDAGAVLVADTCCVVSPIKGRFKSLATDSAKACFYAAAKNGFRTRFLSFEDVIQEALK